MPIEINRGNRSAFIRTTANLTVNVADLSIDSANTDIVNKADIALFMWSGDWTVKRNTTTVAILTNTGKMDFAAVGYKLIANNDQSLVFTTGTTPGVIVTKVTKIN